MSQQMPLIPDTLLTAVGVLPSSTELELVPPSAPTVTGYVGFHVRFALSGTNAIYDFNMYFDDDIFDERTRQHLFYSILLWGRYPFGNGSFSGATTPRNQSRPFEGRGPLKGQGLNNLINHPSIGEGIAINMANYWTFVEDSNIPDPKVSLYIDGMDSPVHPDNGGALGSATLNSYGRRGDLRIELNQLAVGPNSTWYLAMDRLSWAESLSHEVLHTFGWTHPDLPRSDPAYQSTYMVRWLRNRFGPEMYRKGEADAYRYDVINEAEDTKGCSTGN